MARPLERTAHLSHDVIAELRDFFGTIKNAHDKLGLEVEVPYNAFYRATQFGAVHPVQVEQINKRWERWRVMHLRPEVPRNLPLTLDIHDLDLEPAWKRNGSKKK